MLALDTSLFPTVLLLPTIMSQASMYSLPQITETIANTWVCLLSGFLIQDVNRWSRLALRPFDILLFKNDTKEPFSLFLVLGRSFLFCCLEKNMTSLFKLNRYCNSFWLSFPFLRILVSVTLHFCFDMNFSDLYDHLASLTKMIAWPRLLNFEVLAVGTIAMNDWANTRRCFLHKTLVTISVKQSLMVYQKGKRKEK